ncbi:hypothetical protein GCM10020331_007700 [Ectobacillus funiculus]
MLSALTGCSSKQTVSASTIREVHVAADIPISYTPKEEPVKYNNETRKVVYLTFDDGPGIYTPQVLDILNQKSYTRNLLSRRPTRPAISKIRKP